MTDPIDTAAPWPDDMLLTEAHIELLMERGACHGARQHRGQTVAKAAAARPVAALRYAADKLTPERLDACAAAAPWVALSYAADKLTPERLAWCKERCK